MADFSRANNICYSTLVPLLLIIFLSYFKQQKYAKLFCLFYFLLTGIDNCTPNPCTNGQCVDGIRTFTCNCQGTDFTGDRCQTRESSFCWYNNSTWNQSLRDIKFPFNSPVPPWRFCRLTFWSMAYRN